MSACQHFQLKYTNSGNETSPVIFFYIQIDFKMHRSVFCNYNHYVYRVRNTKRKTTIQFFFYHVGFIANPGVGLYESP